MVDIPNPISTDARRLVTTSAGNGDAVLPVPPAFLDAMRTGKYLNILSSYPVSWDLERCARDVWQNFFDPKKTLDGVMIDVQAMPGDGQPTSYLVSIWSPENYDFRKLLHIGGSGKGDDPTTAGGFGEGTKVTALMLLRDFGVTDIIFSSTGWSLQFYFDKLPDGEYDQAVLGLFAKISTENSRPGNSVRFVVKSREHAEAFVSARDLFFHKENPDFRDPTMVVKHPDHGYSGFTFLGNGPNNLLKTGRLYDAGQRRHYEKDTSGWDGVEGLHLWTLGRKAFGSDRERGAVRRDAVTTSIIKPMAAAMTLDESMLAIRKLEPMWETKFSWSHDAARRLLDAVIENVRGRGMTLQFDGMCLAEVGFVPTYIRGSLSAAGYKLCCPGFAQIGMQPALDKYVQLQTHYRVEPTASQLQQIDILKQAVTLVCELAPLASESAPKRELVVKDIWIFDKDNEKNVSVGQYGGEFVWMAGVEFKASFARALATYLHELDHKYGTDQSAEFSYALTDTLEMVIGAMAYRPERFRDLGDRWRAYIDLAS